MRDLVHTTNVVVLDFAQALLRDAGIDCWVADAHIESALGTSFPRRLQVTDEAYARASEVLEEAGLGAELVSRR